MNEYIAVLKKYAVFSGRSARREFWMFVLFNLIVSIVVNFIGVQLGMDWLGSLYALGVFLPGLGVSIRRLHDTGHSGWWLLIGLVPLVGLIVLIVFYATDSTPGANAYGANPKGASAPVAPAAPAPTAQAGV